MRSLNGITHRYMALGNKIIVGRQMIADIHYAKAGKDFAFKIYQPMTLAVDRNSGGPATTHETMSYAGFNSFPGRLNTVKMSCRTTANHTTTMIAAKPLNK